MKKFLLIPFAILSIPFWVIGCMAQFIWQGISDGYQMTKAFMEWIGS